MNIHVPEELKIKYPQYEFRGKQREINNRIVTEQTFFYSFEEDFFWIAGQIPDYKLQKV
jgi:hypothetical protein